MGGINALIKHYDVYAHQITSLYLADEFFTANTGRERQARRPSPLGDQIGGQFDETRRGRRLRGGGEARTAEKVCITYLASCHHGLILCRSLDDIEKRSKALLGKRKVARVLDKTQDASAVTKLIDQLQKAILIYQVCAKISRFGAGLTRTMTGVPTAIDPQPGRTVDGRFPRVVLALSRLTAR